ncbi:hypothetical protein [Rhizobium leguminosarum]
MLTKELLETLGVVIWHCGDDTVSRAASATRHVETLGKFSKICFDTTGSIMSVAGVEPPQSVLKCRA